jgi:hyperosmotically inducible periplasmic protein
MRITMLTTNSVLAAVVVAGALLSTSLVARAAALPLGAGAQAHQENSAASAVEARLNKKQFQGVHATVKEGIATLTGSVELYEYKADAGSRALHTKGVTAVRNLIQVAGPSVPDHDLQAKLAEKLEYDQVGFGNVFDAITVSVNDGAVTLGGHVHNYINRNSALALVATTPGVKDMIDNIEVDPVSTMDDQTRIAVARSIYSFPTMTKYAIDPGMPIRISVQNGHVELYGRVDSQADKDAAYLRANSVPGVFSVKNYLQVAGQPTEKQ